jgi:hypothetical protein
MIWRQPCESPALEPISTVAKAPRAGIEHLVSYLPTPSRTKPTYDGVDIALVLIGVRLSKDQQRPGELLTSGHLLFYNALTIVPD